MIKLQNGGKAGGGSIIVYTNAPESCGVPVAIYKEYSTDLDEIIKTYGCYFEIRWSNWKGGKIPHINDTFLIEFKSE